MKMSSILKTWESKNVYEANICSLKMQKRCLPIDPPSPKSCVHLEDGHGPSNKEVGNQNLVISALSRFPAFHSLFINTCEVPSIFEPASPGS